ncbi:MAG: T9SS type A sorting domain-containing protein [Dinghuibacter sp.]|nr:T9SS type A sorting domain-containing protein [Dinghuibacter sp.]
MALYADAQHSQQDQPDKIIRTFPNPASGFVTFEFSRSYDRGYGLQIFNFTGKKMFEGNNLLSRTTVNLQNFYRGVYLYRLVDRNGKVIESGKFQVVK